VTDDATASWYRRFADSEARGESAIYESWARGVLADEEVLGRIRALPRPKQQPNLVFGVSRLLGAPEGEYGAWRDWALAHWDEIADAAATRSTQTNEPRRCAALLPALGLVTGPIALVELGASAGLCLFPDRYSYLYRGEVSGAVSARLDPVDGPSVVLLESEIVASETPVPIPEAMPRIVWRAGVDLNPLDVRDEDDMQWLRTLTWPEQVARRERIAAAVGIARADPPRIVRGDALDALDSLVGEAPANATVVVVSSGTLVYLDRDRRQRVVDRVRDLGARFLSLEGQGVVPGVVPRVAPPAPAPQPDAPTEFALGLDGELLALVGPHGQRVRWVGSPGHP
jgi:hypothetical protein